MKKNLLSIVYLLIVFGFLFGQTKQQSAFTKIQNHNTYQRCGTMQHMQYLFSNNPGLEQKLKDDEIKLQQSIANQANNIPLKIAPIMTIPTVVHIVWRTGAENISDAQALAMIDRMNEDFRRLNADAVNTPADFLSVAADMEIEYCLALVDPSGNPTNGITRRQTTVTSFSTNDDVKFTANGGDDAWDVTQYFNIWICNLSGNLLGYGEFPTGPPVSNTFGAVQDFCNSDGSCPPFDMNRTMVHELSHCFRLRHIWGDDAGACSGSDLVGDTPNQANSTSGCPGFPTTDACSPSPPGIMFMNYMDYSADACYNMFTLGQKTRARAAITNFLSSLLTSTVCGAPTALDAGISTIISPTGTFCADSIFPVVTLKNFGSNTLTSVDIEYQLDGGPINTLFWTGNLIT
ncbi:MAG: zinc metalloprotease, partial [Cytophagales bacterium]|nr:zinc metalloprotease [Cytophagales bacterium]